MNNYLYQKLLLIGFTLIMTACGGGSNAQLPSAPELPYNITDIASFGKTTCSIRARGTSQAGSIWCWGNNSSSRLGNSVVIGDTVVKPLQIDSGSNWISVSIGLDHICAVSEPGALFCRGLNSNGNIGVDIRAVASENSYYEFVRIGQATDWQSVALAETHSCAIKTNGAVFCWGNNESAQLAISDVVSTGSEVSTPTPILSSAGVDDRSEWLALSTSGTFSWGIKNEINNGTAINSLWCWGGTIFALGNGLENNNLVLYPSQVVLPTTAVDSSWLAVSTGTNHRCVTG